MLSLLPGNHPVVCVPRRMLKAIYVMLCVSASVCLLQEKTDRLTPGNTECVVCGCTSWAESSGYCGMHKFKGVVLHTGVCVCVVCVCSQHEEKEKALKEQLSHLTALLPTLQVRTRSQLDTSDDVKILPLLERQLIIYFGCFNTETWHKSEFSESKQTLVRLTFNNSNS